MPTDPYDAFSKPVAPASGADPYDAISTSATPAPDFQPTKYGFSVKDAVTPDTGKPTKQSKEGFLWYGPEQGNPNPQGGWFNDKGQQVQPAKDADDPALWSNEELSKGMANSISQGVFGAGLPIGALGQQVRSALAALKFGRAAGPVARTIVNTAVGGVAEPAFTDDSNITDPIQKAEQKLMEARHGAKMAGAISLGMEALAPVVTPIAGAVTQGWRRAFGSPAERAAYLQRAQELRDATKSQQFPQGAEPTLGEVMQSPNLKRVENAAEYIPGSGRGAQLEVQNKALAASVGERASQAAPNLGPAGGGSEISASAERALAARRAPAVQLYGEVRAAVGDAKPVVTNTVDAFNKAIKTESGISGPKSAQVKALELERDNLAKGVTGQSYESLEKIQDRLQSHAASGSQSADQVAQDIAKYKSNISKAVSKDLRATADAVDPTGALGDKYGQANDIYSGSYRYDPNAGPSWQGSKVRSANRILHGQDEFKGKVPESLFKGDDADMAKHAFESLDQQGRETVKAAILDRIQGAMKNPKGQTMSPKQASNAIADHQNFIKEFFGPTGHQELQGLSKALSEMQRSGQYMEALTTGKFTPALTATTELGVGALAAVQGHPAVLATSAAVTGASRLFTALSGSRAGKDWLLKVSSSPAGSRMMQNLMDQLPKVLAVTPKGIAPLRPQLSPAAGEGTDPTVAQN